MSTTDLAAQPGPGWDEAQCTAALAHLEQLQAQLDDLRLAIPRVIEPFQRPPNPATFKLYAQGVVGSQNDLKNLHEAWRSPETQRTLEQVKLSLTKNADLAASASIPSHGWVERERREGVLKKENRSETVEDFGNILTDEDIAGIVVGFQKTYTNIKLETRDENCSISTRFVSGAVMLKFHISIEREANGRYKLNAECLGTTEPWQAITRCIASRPQVNDLKYLLDMIAAYKTVKGTSCAKCKKLLDNSLLTPTARRSKKVAGDSPELVWEALHEGCLG
ncbi:uncharacterized protein K460DRAFT_409892 [Cucurbitaria berberidis CBS 394.84]|uniref:Uncharacterized protein n=1 Tax=Cucurbitaria berberidis CBS 394.84 TaxID=1168544 RepID=A0A9P4GC29_9PLEO|nr:uncharacterized protein K460DRAFT_409892 [Cucurbitaria berberidis CBS 394.84]KAF1842484.1 hypothetical protein K460DRAFT_409892 [Cucurbitaria berberidis CBS 394.84]